MSTTMEIKSERTGHCRICQCYEDENMFDMIQGFQEVMGNEDKLQSTCEAFTRTTGIKVSPDDEVSRLVCEQCFTRLKDFLLLRQEAEASRQKIAEIQNLPKGSLETSLEKIKVEKEETEQQCLICMSYDDEMTDIFSDIQFEVDIGNVNKLSHIFEEVLGISPSDYERADKLVCGSCVNRLIESCMIRYQSIKTDESAMEESFMVDELEIKGESFNCQICLKAFADQLEYEAHLPCTDQTTTDKPYDCKVCGKSFPRFYPLKRHMFVHTTERSHVCKICSKAFRFQSDLNFHFKRVHTNYRPHTCKICSKTFKTSSAQLSHFHTHNTEKPFVCKICSKGFNQANYLTRHLTCHSNERPYVCDMCPKTFKISAKLNIHKKSHFDERPYKCHICPKAFKIASILKKHVMAHADCKPYICEICSKSFKQAILLSHHMRIHLDQRPYECKICSKSFRFNGNLHAHMKTHSSERKHICKICSKAFKLSWTLTVHLKTHSIQYSCDICSELFDNASTLYNHKRKHKKSADQKKVC